MAMGEVKADVHSLHHSISACDQRIDGLESGFESRVSPSAEIKLQLLLFLSPEI